MEEEALFIFKNCRLNYSIYGSGRKIMLAYHGFGQNKSYFRVLADTIGKEYLIYSFDLFFHGKSEWKFKDKPLSKKYLTSMMKEFFKDHEIKEFSVCGFSIGAKTALALAEAFPESVKEVYLLAPDGVKENFWYKISTQVGLVKKIFRSSIIQPSFFFKLSWLLLKLRLLDRGVVKFARNQMNSRYKRRRVYYTWMIYSKLVFDWNVFSEELNKNQIKIKFFLSAGDKVIPEKTIKQLSNRLKYSEIIMVKESHFKIIKGVSDYFKKIWNK